MVGPPAREDQVWDLFNRFVIDSSLDRFTKLLARYELFKLVVDLPGDIVECGVFKGAGLFYWAKLIEIFNPLSTRKVIGFDLFGSPQAEATHEWDAPFVPEGAETGDPDALLAKAHEQGLAHRIELHPGDAGKTIPAYAESHPGFRIALLNMDFDNYDPTLAGLAHFFPRVVPGGVVVFDDYGVPQWGESLAVDDFFKDSGYVYTSFPWALSPKAYIRKNP